MKILCFRMIACVFCVFAVASHAQMSDYERQQIEPLLYAPVLEKDLRIFDGQKFNPGIGLDDGYQYMVSYINELNKAINALNRMSSPARGSNTGRELIALAQEKQVYSNAMRSAFPAFEKAHKQAMQAQAVTPSSAAKPSQSTRSRTAAEPASAKASAGLSEQEAASVQQHLDTLAQLFASDDYDGNAFNRHLTLAAAQAFQQQFVEAANMAVQAYNTLSPQAQRSAAGQSLLAQVKTFSTRARGVNGALANHRAMMQRHQAETIRQAQQADKQKRQEAARRVAAEKRQEEARVQAAATKRDQIRAEIAPACAAFEEAVMTRRNKKTMAAYLRNPDAVLADYKSISRFVKRSDRIALACTDPAYVKVLEAGCSEQAEDDPKTWCESAKSAREAVKKHILRNNAAWEILAEARYISADKLDDNNGWVPIEGPTTLEQTLSFDRMMYINTVDFGPDQQRALFADLQIQAAHFPHYDATLDYIDELRDAIDDGANDWPAVPRADSYPDTAYGPKLAGEQINQQWHVDATVKDAWLSRSNWKVIKNDVGIILRRTLPGHVLFKLPDDPYCQLRSFTLTEQYVGDGSFQPAKGVRFGYVRFQHCPS